MHEDLRDGREHENTEEQVNNKINNGIFSKGAYTDEDNQGSKEGNEDIEKELQEEIKADEGKGKDTQEQKEDNGQEISGDSGPQDIASGQTDDVSRHSQNYGQHAASSYEPPYYTPNFTFANDNASERTDDKALKPKRSHGVTVIIVSAILSIAIAITVGGIAGYFAYCSANVWCGALGGDTATIIKSDGRVEVSKVVETGDYPAMDVSGVASAVGNSVVEISTSMTQTHPFYGQYVTSGAGSGVILVQSETSHIGYIVTNYHVVEGADSITVRLANGNSYEARYRAGDKAMDIAVVEIQANEALVCAQIGNSDKLAVGDSVVAIGNPLGELGGTVTDGIISALERQIIIDDNSMTLLQTNAAINPGNSGGGLFDMGGRLIGIVNAKQAAEGIEGLGFAIPINHIEQALEDILSEEGYVRNRPSLGIETSYGESVYLAAGLYVIATDTQDSPLKVGDRIVSINGTEIDSKLKYNVILSSLTINENANITVIRDGRQMDISITVSEDTSI